MVINKYFRPGFKMVGQGTNYLLANRVALNNLKLTRDQFSLRQLPGIGAYGIFIKEGNNGNESN